VLHHVSPDLSGELDSTRVGPDGRFRFALPDLPEEDTGSDIYFASIRHDGILYFGEAIARRDQLDTTYVIRVYDVEEAPASGAALPVQTRNLFFEALGDTAWRATDLIVVHNPGPRTLVAADSGLVWAYALPDGAHDLELGDASALPPDALTLTDGLLRLRAPLPPGERTLVVRYLVPPPPLRVPLPGRTGAMELLVREPAPPLRVDGLQPVELVSIEPGSTYRRYSGADLEDVTVRIVVGQPGGSFPVEWVAVVLALVLAAAGLAAYGRRRPAAPVAAHGAPGPDAPIVASAAERREALLLRVARIDERLEAAEGEERAALETERRELIAELARTR